MCRDAADARLLGEALLGRPLASRRATTLRLGVGAGFWQDLDPEVETRSDAALDALRGGRRRGRATSRWRAPSTCVIATVMRLTLEGFPSRKPELFQEIQHARRRRSAARSGSTTCCCPPPRSPAPTVVRAQLRRSLARAFEEVDVLAWPTMPAPPPPIEDPTVELPSGRVPADFGNVRQGGIGQPRRRPGDLGPVGLTAGGLPVALQLLAPWGEDERLLDIAELLEQATDRRHVEAVPPVAQQAASLSAA